MSNIANFPKGPDNVAEQAAEMTDQELRALVIMNFRMLQEILEFTRHITQTIGEMQSNGGMMGRMMGGLVPPGISPEIMSAARRDRRR